MEDDSSGKSRRAFLVTGALTVAGGCISSRVGDRSAETPERPRSAAGTPTATPVGTPTETSTATPTPEVVPPYRGAYRRVGGLVDDVSDLSLWSGVGTVRADGDARFRGEQSLYYENDTKLRLQRSFAADDPLDLTDRALSFAAWCERPVTVQPTLVVTAHAPDADNRVFMRTPYNANKDAGWQRYDTAISEVEGSPDLSNVRELHFGAWADGETFRFHLADLRTHPKPDRGKVIFRFDDSHRHHYTDYFPILERYGYPGIAAIVKQAIGRDDRLTVAQMRELREAGWDMCNHMVHHDRITDLSDEELRANIDEMDAFFEEVGAPEGKDLAVLTYGGYDGRSLDCMADNFDLVFGGEGLGNYTLTNPALVSGVDVDGDLEKALELVDDAARSRSLAIPVVHKFDAGKFERLVEHVHELDEAGSLDVITGSDLHEHLYGN